MPEPTGKDAALLKEITDRFDYASSYWRDVHEEGRKDMLCVAGDPWEALDPAGKKQRETAKRPALALDELGQYFNQVINDVRANKRAVEFTPAGNGADDKTAKFYADKMRDIEHRSHAQIAYTIAFENAVQRGYGYCRLTTKKATRRSPNYELCIEPVHNPDSVLIDPESVMPDGSDMQWAFVMEPYRHEEFARKYHEAEIQDFKPYMATHSAWIKEKTVLLAEYWAISTKERELIHFAPGGNPAQVDSVFADEGKPPKGSKVVKKEKVDWPSVTQYITNGLEILETKPWVGSFIPIACCYGKVIYVDHGTGPERTLLSMTRLARDPFMLYCYMRTCQAEVVGGIPKFPYFIRKGSLDQKNLDNLAKSVHEPISVIEVEANVEGMRGDSPPEFPQRNPFTGEALGYMDMSAEAMRRAIQAAMGVSPMPTQAQRRNEKSGVALKQIEASQQKGSFHFVDHYDYMIQHVGTMCEDAFEPVYDTARQTSIRKPNDTAEMVWINNPQEGDKNYPTKGDHIVTVSTGPSYESERDRVDDFVGQLAQNEQLFPVVGDLLVKMKNLGPMGDELAKRLEALLPPPVKAIANQKDGQEQMIPAAEVQAQMQQVQAQMGEMAKVIETKQVEQQGKLQQAQMDNQTRLQIAQIQADTALAVAKLKEGAASAELQVQHAEEQMGHEVDLLKQQREFEHEDQQAQDQQAHEAGMARMGAKQQRDGAEHQSGLAKDQASHQAALEPKDNGAGA